MTLFIVLAVLLTLATLALVLWPVLRQPKSGPIAAAVGVIVPIVALAGYLTASTWQWDFQPMPANHDAASGPSMDDAIEMLAARLRENPDNFEGWQLLARSYLQRGRYGEAAEALARARRIAPPDLALPISLDYAEALILAGMTSGEATDIVEAALRSEPENPKALWYGGLLAERRGEPEVARARFSTMLGLSPAPPPEIERLLRQRLDALGGPLSAPADGTAIAAADSAPSASAAAPTAEERAAPAEPVTADGEPALRLRVRLAPEIRDRLPNAGAVFVLARDVNPGPPIAAKRLALGQLPTDVILSDGDAMLPGRSLWTVDQLELVARISTTGRPNASPGDLFGQLVVDPEGARGGTFELVIDQVVP